MFLVSQNTTVQAFYQNLLNSSEQELAGSGNRISPGPGRQENAFALRHGELLAVALDDCVPFQAEQGMEALVVGV